MKENSFIFNFKKNDGLRFFAHAIVVVFILVYIPISMLIASSPHLVSSIHTVTSYYQKNVLSKSFDGITPDNIILGDSAISSAIDAAIIPKSLSLASWGASPFAMSSFLNRYIQKNPQPNCVILGLHYYTIHNTNIEYLDAIFTSNAFDWSELYNFYLQSKSLNDYPSNKISMAKYLLTILGYKINFFGNYTRGLSNAVFSSKHEKDLYNNYLKTLKNHSGSFARPKFMKDIRSDIFVGITFNKFEPHPIYDFYLQRIADELATMKVRVEVVFPPISPLKDSATIHNYKDQLGRHLRSIFTDSNVSFAHYEPPKFDASYFPDQVHLNQLGASKYTKYLLNKGICK